MGHIDAKFCYRWSFHFGAMAVWRKVRRGVRIRMGDLTGPAAHRRAQQRAMEKLRESITRYFRTKPWQWKQHGGAETRRTARIGKPKTLPAIKTDDTNRDTVIAWLSRSGVH
jgi:hypothetical protein